MSLAIFSKLIKSGFDRITNEDINNGDCYHWALLVKQMFPEATLCSNDCHAWIYLNGKYYDSESPNGVSSHKQLKCNQQCKNYQIWKYKHIKLFKRRWEIVFLMLFTWRLFSCKLWHGAETL